MEQRQGGQYQESRHEHHQKSMVSKPGDHSQWLRRSVLRGSVDTSVYLGQDLEK